MTTLSAVFLASINFGCFYFSLFFVSEERLFCLWENRRKLFVFLTKKIKIKFGKYTWGILFLIEQNNLISHVPKKLCIIDSFQIKWGWTARNLIGRKSTARHKIYQLLESSKCLLNCVLSIARIEFKIAVDHYFLLINLQKPLEFNLLDTFCS